MALVRNRRTYPLDLSGGRILGPRDSDEDTANVDLSNPHEGALKTLSHRLETLPKVKVILALGKIAHDSTLKTLGARIAAHPFKHGVAYDIGRFKLISSYHCSRYNTNTGVLTTKMFEDVVGRAKTLTQK